MGGFLLRKVGAALIVLLLASMLVFVGVRALPGDPAIALGAREPRPGGAGGDPAQVRPRPAAAGAVRASGSGSRCSGDLGVDQRELPVAHTIVTRLPITLELAFLAILVGIADRHPGRDHRGGPARQAGGLRRDDGRRSSACRVPHFWLGLLMIIFFAVEPALAAGRRLRPVLARTRSRTSSTC